MFVPMMIPPRTLRGFGNLEYDATRGEVEALSAQITDLHLGTQAYVSRFGVDQRVANDLIDRIQLLGTQVDNFDNRDTYTRSDYEAARRSYDILAAEFEQLQSVALRNTALLSVGAVAIIAGGAWLIWKKG